MSENQANQPQEAASTEPEIFALNRNGNSWKLSRRSFMGTAAASAAVTGCSSNSAPECKDTFAHDGPVAYLAVSADGTRFASSGHDEHVKIWSLPEGGLIARKSLAAEAAHPKICFGADRKQILLSFNNQIWSWQNPKQIDESYNQISAPIGGEDHTDWAATPDGKFLVCSYTGESIVKVRELPSGTVSQSFRTLRSIQSLAIGPAGDLLVGAGRHEITVWSLSTLNVLLKIESRLGNVELIALNRDASLLAVADSSGDVTIWTGDGKLATNLSGHTGSVKAMVFSGDNTQLLTGGIDSTVKVWSMNDGSLLKDIPLDETAIESMAFTPNGKQLIVGGAKSIHLWSLPEGKQTACLLDLECNEKKTKGLEYDVTTEEGETISYTLPCGSPIPEGTVCTCNCVPGKIAPAKAPSSSGNSRPRSRSRSTSYWYPN